MGGGGRRTATNEVHPGIAQEEAALEAALLAKAKHGNAFAFEEIVRRYQRRVYAVALRIVRRHDMADDVTQEAFIRAYRALATFELTKSFGPWISRIAANVAINQVRSPRSREEPLPEEGHRDLPSAMTSPLDGVLENESTQVLERALSKLPP